MLNKLVHIVSGMVSWFTGSSWKKKTLIIGAVLIAGFFIGKKILSDKTSGYVLGTVQKRTITEIVTESGIVTTNGRVNIYSPTNGVIGDVFVTNGEEVGEDQKLFTVKSTATPQEQAAAYAAFQASRTAVQQAENTRRETMATVDRVHDDLKNKDTTETFSQKETRTSAEVANDNAYDSLISARAQLASDQVAWQSTQNAVVSTPISGVVSNLSVVKGSSVSVNSALAPAVPVLIISGIGTAEIMIAAGESDINKIKVGQPVSIKFDAIDNRIYQGLVRRFDQHGTIVQGVVKFNVYIEITDAQDLIRPGMTADVDIITSELADVLSVPNAAVKPYQKGRAVRKLGSGGQLEYLPVKIGVRGKEFTQITEGLTEGQEIVESLTNEKAKRAGPFGF